MINEPKTRKWRLKVAIYKTIMKKPLANHLQVTVIMVNILVELVGIEPTTS
jgi:hypothetical protein